MPSGVRNLINVLVDEAHGGTFKVHNQPSVGRDERPNASKGYSLAAQMLTSREFRILRNCDAEFTSEILENIDVLVISQPSSTSDLGHPNSHRFTRRELGVVEQFVERGGGLLVLSGSQHDRFRTNINSLLNRFGIDICSTTVTDPVHHYADSPTWVLGEPPNLSEHRTSLLVGIERVCFADSGCCTATGSAFPILISSERARPARAPLAAGSVVDNGRVIAVSSSALFSDGHISTYSNSALWINIFYWLSASKFASADGPSINAATHPEAWSTVKDLTNRLRALQRPDGSIGEIGHQEHAARIVAELVEQISGLDHEFPHQSEYFTALRDDLNQWYLQGFGRPVFDKSLAAFRPETQRSDGLTNVAHFPMYTPNSSLDTRFDCVLTQVYWPSWLAEIHSHNYRENDKFVPAQLVDYSDGYVGECAVLFPETVSIAGSGSNAFGMIFCDREWSRYSSCVSRVIEITAMNAPPDLRAFLSSSDLLLGTFALWDLIHDTSHSRGELPFDPFMIRQRAPFWMYALEELRVDLRSYLDASGLVDTYGIARYVKYAVLLDRIFRFAISGSRVRNYDALAGQLLFTFLHNQEVLSWSDNTLTIDWTGVDSAVATLHAELSAVYRRGQVVSKVRYWANAHDFICKYMSPAMGSKWEAMARVFDSEVNPSELIAQVLDDEFPLGSFHSALKRRV